MPFHFEIPITDPVLIFALVMLILLLAPLLIGRLRMPGIVGLILAGAIVGPSALGLLERDATIELLGTVGLVYLIFTTGLSMDLDQLKRYRYRSMGFGFFTFFVPQVLAIAYATHLLGMPIRSALLLGSVVGTHTLLAYPLARSLGIARNAAVTVTTGGSIIADSLGLIILAAVAASTAGDLSSAFWLRFAGWLLGYVLLVVLGLPRLGRWFFRNVQDETRTDFIFLLAVVFGSAYLAQLVGLAPIIGAFFAGLMLNRLVPERSPLMNRVQFVGDALFIPFFLLSVGMLVDFRVLFTSWQIWALAGLLIWIVAGGKVLAAKLTQWIFGFTPAEGWTMAGLSIPQAAATLAVTLVGFDLELFDQTVVNAVIIMILVTCLLGPWLVDKHGRRVAVQAAPPAEPRTVPQRILVPLGRPATVRPLLDLAFMLREARWDQPIFPLAVARDGEGVEARVAEAEKTLEYAVVHAAAADVPVNPVTRVDMHVASGIIHSAKELRISTVLIGWRGESTATERIFGTVLDQLLQLTQPLMVVARLVHPVNTVRRVILALPPLADREPGFEQAYAAVRRLSRQAGAPLTMVSLGSTLQRIESRFGRADNLRPAHHPIELWTRLLPALAALVKGDDLVVLLTAREGRLSWMANMADLPRRFARRFAETSFLVLYPPEALAEPSALVETGAAPPAAPTLLDPQGVLLGLEDLAPADALQRLLEKRYGAQGLRQLARAVARSAQEYPIEVTPGVVLVHAHGRQVVQPTLLLATSRQGLVFPRIGARVHVLLLLLGPPRMPRDRHLQALAQVAHLVHESQVVQKLREAPSVEQVQDLLAEAAAGGETLLREPTTHATDQQSTAIPPGLTGA